MRIKAHAEEEKMKKKYIWMFVIYTVAFWIVAIFLFLLFGHEIVDFWIVFSVALYMIGIAKIGFFYMRSKEGYVKK